MCTVIIEACISKRVLRQGNDEEIYNHINKKAIADIQ